MRELDIVTVVNPLREATNKNAAIQEEHPTVLANREHPTLLANKEHTGNALRQGVMLGSYRVDGVLGQGGFGITYKAFDTRLHRYVAIKEYLPNDLACRDHLDNTVRSRTLDHHPHFEKFRNRFLEEARLLARFSHPNLVRVLNFIEQNNTVYLAMDFEEGESLSALLKREGTLSQERLLAIMKPLMEGLQALHQEGVIHRDIKPANILVRSKDGSPILLDFGSARPTVSEGESQTMTSLLSSGYAPLEQYYSDGKSQGSWTDIYAMGAVMYHAISGRRPVASFDRTRILTGKGPDPLVAAVVVGQGKYAPGLLQAIDWALKMDHLQRPREVAEWLLSFSGLEGLKKEPKPTKKLCKRSDIIIAVIVLVVAVTLGGVVILQQRLVPEKNNTLPLTSHEAKPDSASKAIAEESNVLPHAPHESALPPSPSVPMPSTEPEQVDIAKTSINAAIKKIIPVAETPLPTKQKSPSIPAWQVTLITSNGHKEGIYHAGDKIKFKVVAKQQSYLYIFNIDSDESIVLLYPIAGKAPAKIISGLTMNFPTSDMGIDLQVEPPFGLGKIWAIVTANPIKLPPEKNPVWKQEEAFRQMVNTLGKQSGGFAEDTLRVVTKP